MSDRQYIEMPGSQELYREFNMVEAVRAEDTVFVSGQPECRAAGTGVRVAELADPRLVIEIEATAVVID